MFAASFAVSHYEHIGSGATAVPWSFMVWRLKCSLDLILWPPWPAGAGLWQALAAQFCNAVNSEPGKNAKSGKVLEPAVRVHAG
jgi:hypothetical protein